ncbi:MAG: GDP-mannose 4,6-dehydratase [Planctomycetaceae bacterium]|jgi:GDP-4-dehydro-6-deoxy-D-mannose reductase|nr:GDP-mannose 4,6-dehydratase [Planctomycetaceae bacterium]
MTKYLITGAGGFVGCLLLNHLGTRNEPKIEVLALDVRSPRTAFPAFPFSFRFEAINLQDKERLETAVATFKPDMLIHLAAMSSVAASWEDPTGCISNNTQIILNVLETVRLYCPRCRILAVGSAEVYNTGGRDEHSPPLVETSPLHSVNPYALGRQAQELIVKFYVEQFGLDIVSTRSFSHTGPGQGGHFAVAAFVQQLLNAKNSGEKTAVLKTGNTDLVRDFSDARDVVRAYDLLLLKGKSGEFYNVCSGRGVSLRKIIETAAGLLDLQTVITVDPARLRPNDPNYIIGSPEKLRTQTGWTATYLLEQTLRDMLAVR